MASLSMPWAWRMRAMNSVHLGPRMGSLSEMAISQSRQQAGSHGGDETTALV